MNLPSQKKARGILAAAIVLAGSALNSIAGGFGGKIMAANDGIRHEKWKSDIPVLKPENSNVERIRAASRVQQAEKAIRRQAAYDKMMSAKRGH